MVKVEERKVHASCLEEDLGAAAKLAPAQPSPPLYLYQPKDD
jgi:hypothetical protein